MKKEIKIIALLFLLTVMVRGQQLQFYSSWFDYPMLYNPSFAGNDYHVNIGLLHRSQFTGFQGAPVMNLVLADGKLQTAKAYTGGFITNQHKGIFNNTQAQVMYAYRLNFNTETYLKLGLALGILDQNLDYSAIVVQNYSDPNIFMSGQHRAGLDANAGFSFYWKALQLGFSVPYLTGSRLNYNDYSGTRAYYALSRHYAGSLRYDISLSRGKELYLSPFFLLRFVQNAPLQFDGGLMLDWRDKFRVGGFYRSAYAVTACASFTLNRRLTLGYNYDIAIGSLGTYSGLTHEITFNFKIGRLKPKPGEDSLDALERKVQNLEKEVAELKAKKTEQKTNPGTQGGDQNKGQAQPKDEGKKAADFKPTTTKENGIKIITDKRDNYVFSTGNPVPKGFYVVVGSYFYQDYAEKEVKRYISFGYPEADNFINKRDKFHYVYIYKADSKEEAMVKAAEARVSGMADVWVEILIE